MMDRYEKYKQNWDKQKPFWSFSIVINGIDLLAVSFYNSKRTRFNFIWSLRWFWKIR